MSQSEIHPDLDARKRLGPFSSLRSFAIDIKLAHSVFALPFAAAAIPFLQADTLRAVSWKHFLLLLGCMIGARSFAMGMNRFLDRHLDSKNPRTKGREIPKGALSPGHSLAWSLTAGSLLVINSFALNPLAGWLSLPLLALLATYSIGKHFTPLVHWYLGMCLGFAPLGVQIALEGRVTLPVALLGIAVTLWTAGFDVLYSLQDMAFDRKYGLRSIPVALGVNGSLWMSRLCFAAMTTVLLVVKSVSERGGWYLAGVAVVTAILLWEHWLVRDTDAEGRNPKINAAFFNWNAAVSICFFAFTFIDWMIGPAR